MDAPFLIALLVGSGGIGTLIFVALRFQREDAGATVAQQGQVVKSMRELIDELQEALDRCRTERMELEQRVVEYVAREDRLKAELAEARTER